MHTHWATLGDLILYIILSVILYKVLNSQACFFDGGLSFKTKLGLKTQTPIKRNQRWVIWYIYNKLKPKLKLIINIPNTQAWEFNTLYKIKLNLI